MSIHVFLLGVKIAKPGRATFEKRQREQGKKKKQEEKRRLRAERKAIKSQNAIAQSERVFIRKWSSEEFDSELSAALAIWDEADEAALTLDEVTHLILDKNELNWAVIKKETGEVIGNCEFLMSPDSFEMKLQIRRSEWGCGIGSETARLAIGYVRENYTEARFRVKTKPDNQQSIRLLKKLGFAQESATKEELCFIKN